MWISETAKWISDRWNRFHIVGNVIQKSQNEYVQYFAKIRLITTTHETWSPVSFSDNHLRVLNILHRLESTCSFIFYTKLRSTLTSISSVIGHSYNPFSVSKRNSLIRTAWHYFEDRTVWVYYAWQLKMRSCIFSGHNNGPVVILYFKSLVQ